MILTHTHALKSLSVLNGDNLYNNNQHYFFMLFFVAMWVGFS